MAYKVQFAVNDPKSFKLPEMVYEHKMLVTIDTKTDDVNEAYQIALKNGHDQNKNIKFMWYDNNK